MHSWSLYLLVAAAAAATAMPAPGEHVEHSHRPLTHEAYELVHPYDTLGAIGDIHLLDLATGAASLDGR